MNNKRMSGEALEELADQFIGELQDEAAYEEIVKLKDILSQLRGIDSDINRRWDEASKLSGISRSDMGNPQLVGGITASVPEALAVEYADGTFGGNRVRNETRFHTKYQPNQVTGQPDVVPFVAKGESKPLITEFGLVDDGLSRDATEGMHSDEFLGKRVLQLIGRDPIANNTGNNYTAVDLVDRDTRKGVDVELLNTANLRRYGNSVGMQAYTQIVPSSMAGQRPSTKEQSKRVASQMVKELEPMLKQTMTDGGLSMVEAVNVLTREGSVSNASGDRAPYGGKLLKEGGNYADKVVYPVFTNDEAFQNLRTSNYGDQPRGLVQPLSGAYLGDVRAAQELLHDTVGKEAADKLSVRPLPGNDGRTPSGKLYLQVPADNQAVLTNLGERSGFVRQLFRRQKKR